MASAAGENVNGRIKESKQGGRQASAGGEQEPGREELKEGRKKGRWSPGGRRRRRAEGVVKRATGSPTSDNSSREEKKDLNWQAWLCRPQIFPAGPPSEVATQLPNGDIKRRPTTCHLLPLNSCLSEVVTASPPLPDPSLTFHNSLVTDNTTFTLNATLS